MWSLVWSVQVWRNLSCRKCMLWKHFNALITVTLCEQVYVHLRVTPERICWLFIWGMVLCWSCVPTVKMRHCKSWPLTLYVTPPTTNEAPPVLPSNLLPFGSFSGPGNSHSWRQKEIQWVLFFLHAGWFSVFALIFIQFTFLFTLTGFHIQSLWRYLPDRSDWQS